MGWVSSQNIPESQLLTGAWQGKTHRICAPSLQAALMRPHVVGTLWLLPDAL